MSYQFHSEDKKAKARELRAKGLSFAKIAAQINVPSPTVYKWHRDAQPAPSSRLTAHDLKLRKAKHNKLSHAVVNAINAFLREYQD